MKQRGDEHLGRTSPRGEEPARAVRGGPGGRRSGGGRRRGARDSRRGLLRALPGSLRIFRRLRVETSREGQERAGRREETKL